MKKICLLFFMLASSCAFAQVSAPINSSEIFDRYVKLINQDKKEEALAELNKVDRNDTNYIIILYKKCDLLLSLDMLDESIAASDEGLGNDNVLHHAFYNYKGVALLRSKKHEEAMKIFQEGLKKFPKNYLMLSNLGTTYKEMGKPQEALKVFKETVIMNPYFGAGHLNLAIMAENEGLVCQAMMAYNAYLLIDPDSQKSLSVLKRLLEIVTSKYERTSANIAINAADTDDYSEIDLIITNYAALNKSYKIPVKTDLALIKQNHAMLSKLVYDKNDPGFWMQTYVPLFTEIKKQNLFEAFSYYILQGSQNEAHKSLVKKNMALVKKFTDWIGPQLAKMNFEREVEINGEKKLMQHYYNTKSYYPETVGNLNSEGNLHGPVEYWSKAGGLLSKGEYVNGKKTGKWEYFFYSGAQSQEYDYNAEGKVHGTFKNFHENGKLYKEGIYVNDKQQEWQKVYNEAGLLTEHLIIKDHLLEGKFTYYFEIGDPWKKFEGTYKAGKLHDTLYEYYSRGELSATKVFSNDVKNGINKVYFRNGQLKFQINYVNDQMDGGYIRYYPDGKVFEEGQYKAGNLSGTWKKYFADGKVEMESQYDEKGKKNGYTKAYDADGKIHYEITYTKGEITAYKFFDKDGKVFKEAKKEKGEFIYQGFYADGTQLSEGVLTADGEKGLWKYYNYDGILSSEQSYVKGQLDGKVKRYFETGKLSREENYKKGDLDGYFVSYFINGNKRTEGWHVNGKKHGYWHYYFMNGELKNKEYYVKGKQSGYQQEFSVSGRLFSEEYIKDGKMIREVYYDSTGAVASVVDLPEGTGNYLLYYNNKQLKFNGNYITGIAHGDFLWYYYDGKLRSKGAYHNGKRDGKWTWYNENGKLQKEGSYVNGDQSGEWKDYYPTGKVKKLQIFDEEGDSRQVKYFYENGKLEVSKTFIDDDEDGDTHYYSESEELQMIRTMKAGKIISYTYKNTSGELVSPILVKGGTFRCQAFYQNGNKSREYEMVNGLYEGDYIEYYTNGKVRELRFYVNDKREGKEITYYPDGKIKSEISYKNGLLNGPSVYYFPDGKPEKTENYVMDVRHGDFKYYNSAGKLITIRTFYSDSCIKEIKH